MTGLFHIVVQRLALSLRDRFSRWFPPVVQDPEPQGPRGYLEAVVAEVLDTADRVARSLRREMNHIALGLPHREAKQAISVRLREAAASRPFRLDFFSYAVSPPRAPRPAPHGT